MKNKIVFFLLTMMPLFLLSAHVEAGSEPEDYFYEIHIKTCNLEDQKFQVKITRQLKKTTDHTPEKLHEITIEKGTLKDSFFKENVDDDDTLYAKFNQSRFEQINPGQNIDDDEHVANFSFIYKIQGLGLIKVNQQGEAFFSQDADLSLLAPYDIKLITTGNLFIQTLKVQHLTLEAPVTELGGVVDVHTLKADQKVFNNGGLQLVNLQGYGNFTNHGIITFKRTAAESSMIAIREFKNKKHETLNLTSKVTANYLAIACLNKIIENGEGAFFDVKDYCFIDKVYQHLSTFKNAGVSTFGSLKSERPLVNTELGQLTIKNKGDLNAGLSNEGELNTPVNFALKSLAPQDITTNKGHWEHKGDFDLSGTSFVNKGTLILTEGEFKGENADITNENHWVMDNMVAQNPLSFKNNGKLVLKKSVLPFSELINTGELHLHSGQYVAAKFDNQKSLFLHDNDWTLSDDPRDPNPAPHRLLASFVTVGHISADKNLVYNVSRGFKTLTAQGNITLTERASIPQFFWNLKLVTTPGKVLWHAPSLKLTQKSPVNFSTIGDLEIQVKGDFTAHIDIRAPKLKIKATGKLSLGENSQNLNVLAATKGALYVIASDIDGRFGKFYGARETSLEAQNGDLTIGDAIPGKDFIKSMNGAYAESGASLFLKAAKSIIFNYGQTHSGRDQYFTAEQPGGKITNVAGNISSKGDIFFFSPQFSNTRADTYDQPVGNWTWAYSGCYNVCESSDQAIIRALGTIHFMVDQGHNLASSILAGRDILYRPFTRSGGLFGGKSYSKDQPSTFTSQGRTNSNYGYNDKAGKQQGCSRWHFPSTILAGEKIQLSLGGFSIDAVVNAGGDIDLNATGSGAIVNTARTRETGVHTKPIVVNVTKVVQEKAQIPGRLRLDAHGAVLAEFPTDDTYVPTAAEVLAFQTSHAFLPLFNPLAGVNLDLHIMSVMAQIAGQVHASNAKGKDASKILWGNAGKWRLLNNKNTLTEEDLATTQESMLIVQSVVRNAQQQLDTLLVLTPNDLNPYKSSGDMVGQNVTITTGGDQTHANSRIVAYGKKGIHATSTGGSLNLATQSYTTERNDNGIKAIQDHAMPQQQMLAVNGPVTLDAHKDINRTGDLIAAADKVTETAATGEVTKNPLILQTLVETKHEESDLFSSSSHTETSLTHQALPSTTMAGTQLHNKAATKITAVAPNDSAGESIVYEAPETDISGLLTANRVSTNSTESNGISDTETKTAQETAYVVPATIKAPTVTFKGDKAAVNATIEAKEIHDETEQGVRFIAKVAEMLNSHQTLTSSPLMSADIGVAAGQECMIPCMLLVEKIIRTKPNGQILFESVVMDKDKTAIIGKFVEATYQLKQWQTSWSHVEQIIPDEALVVVALAVAVATQGVGVEFMAPLLEGFTTATGTALSATGVAMVNAGFSAVCATAASVLLQSGDPLKSIQQLATPTHLRSLAVTMASAGLLSKLSAMLDINMKPEFKSCADHLQEKALAATIDALLNISVNNMPVDQALATAVKDIPMKALSAYMANQIGKLALTGKLNATTRKIAHAALGAGVGYATQHNSRGAVAGAVGALTTDILGDLIIGDGLAIAETVIDKLKQAGQPLSDANIDHAIQVAMKPIGDWTKVAAGSVAVLLGLNPHTAISASTNAVEHDANIRRPLYASQNYKAVLESTSRMLALILANEKAYAEAEAEVEKSLKTEETKDKPVLFLTSGRYTGLEPPHTFDEENGVNPYDEFYYVYAYDLRYPSNKPVTQSVLMPDADFMYPAFEEMTEEQFQERSRLTLAPLKGIWRGMKSIYHGLVDPVMHPYETVVKPVSQLLGHMDNVVSGYGIDHDYFPAHLRNTPTFQDYYPMDVHSVASSRQKFSNMLSGTNQFMRYLYHADAATKIEFLCHASTAILGTIGGAWGLGKLPFAVNPTAVNMTSVADYMQPFRWSPRRLTNTNRMPFVQGSALGPWDHVNYNKLQVAGLWNDSSFMTRAEYFGSHDSELASLITQAKSWNKDPKAPYVFASHGSKRGIAISKMKGLPLENNPVLNSQILYFIRDDVVGHRVVSRLIKADPAFNKENYVVLLSCCGGGQPNPINLANKLGAAVIAPPGGIWASNQQIISAASLGITEHEMLCVTKPRGLVVYYPGNKQTALHPSPVWTAPEKK